MLRRRTLLQSGAAALAWPHQSDAAYLIFGSGLRAGTRQFSVPNNAYNDTTSNSLNSRMTCFAPSQSAIVGLLVSFPGFGFNNPEAPLPTASYTVTAAVEYPAGTFTPLTINGARSLTVVSSELVYSYDFLPISIPAGAAFYIKTFVQWSAGAFWMCDLCASFLTTDWTIAGTGLSDNTLTTTTFLSNSINYGFGPSVYAAFALPQKSVGLIGDSIGAAAADTWDPTTGSRFYERALRNVLPIINVARGSDSFVRYLQQNQGRCSLLIGYVDRLICQYGRNDISAGASLATVQAEAQSTWAPYLAAGIKVWQTTITPQTTSTDGWATTANQTVASSAAETVRVQFNAWIRANYISLGLSGYLDNAHAVDPTDSGLWSADGTPGTGAAAFCTLTSGAVSAAVMALYQQSGKGSGNSYPINSTVVCTVRGYPGEIGTLPTITGNANASGLVLSYNIVSAGANLLYPPMVAANGAWTPDGTHPNARGFNEIIYQTGVSPTTFA